MIENRKYLSKLDETWPESGRVDRSGDAGRRPRAKFEPKRVKKAKTNNKSKINKLRTLTPWEYMARAYMVYLL